MFALKIFSLALPIVAGLGSDYAASGKTKSQRGETVTVNGKLARVLKFQPGDTVTVDGLPEFTDKNGKKIQVQVIQHIPESWVVQFAEDDIPASGKEKMVVNADKLTLVPGQGSRLFTALAVGGAIQLGSMLF